MQMRLQSFASSSSTASQRAIAAWLLFCAAMLFAMVVVGGVTRLTHSGLSIVEWQPIVGTMPPLGEDQWTEVFEKYKQTPEYKRVNFDMGLDDFKGIFWWEYFHRLLGRLIGVVFLLPYLYFLFRGRVRGSLSWKLAGIFVLGGLQGAMGWYMVASGLVDDPRVSHFRLTAHLGIALVIYAAMLWVAFDLLYPRAEAEPGGTRTRLYRPSLALTALVFVAAITGGFVAGIRAGYAYNTFPLMNGNWVPPEIFLIEPWHLNFFNNMATVQFDHRLMAWLIAMLVLWLWWKGRSLPTRARTAIHWLLGFSVIQISLGIATLLLAVPVALAATHQAGALALLSAALFASHTLRQSNPIPVPA